MQYILSHTLCGRRDDLKYISMLVHGQWLMAWPSDQKFRKDEIRKLMPQNT